VLRVFMITGTAIGFFGTLAGFLLGIGFAANIENVRSFVEANFETRLFPSWLFFLTRLPAKIDTDEVTTVVIAALLMSVAATIYPSLRAARLDPVEALRYE
jgi:lipoprotein-releasing system permease protein